ncbi:MAG: hypothetical protein KGD63_00525 [Candidatus Lokiarchaeota archaeon]|nr:hypothetical protein [Candidatus Lokiarchaeota archaeon]
MGAGKYLAIIAAILTILGSYVFAMFPGTAPNTVASALGVFEDIGQTFESADSYGSAMGGVWVVYIVIILMIIFAISGFVQLIGIKSRAGIFIFSLFPLVIGTIMLMAITIPISNIYINYMMAVLSDSPLIEDTFPYLLNIGDLGLGVILVVAGGAVGIISAVLPREETY